jgi:DNA polymerase-3 subunit alpha
VAYQTAYMKAYWPVEYMAAVLTYAMEKMEEVVDYIAECMAMGIKVHPPDINESFSDFTVVYEKDKECTQEHGFIRFGLSAVKGVGEKAVEEIVSARHKVGQFASLYQFCEMVDMRAVNKQVVESLIKAGAFDRLGGSRAQMLAACEKAMQAL